MGSKGDCYDNAVAESFFATLKKELVHRYSWSTRRELTSEVFEYIEAFYNPRRRHSTLGMRSPADFENSTLPTDGASLAASRLASPHQETSQNKPGSSTLSGGTGELQDVCSNPSCAGGPTGLCCRRGQHWAATGDPRRLLPRGRG